MSQKDQSDTESFLFIGALTRHVGHFADNLTRTLGEQGEGTRTQIYTQMCTRLEILLEELEVFRV